MAHHLNVWREAGKYGPAGGFQAQKNLGRHVFHNEPRVGQHVNIRGEEWIVTSVEPAVMYVVPKMAS